MRATKADTHGAKPDAFAPRNPMVGSLPGCCAFADNGHIAATPPNNVMRSRRLIAAPKTKDEPSYRFKMQD